MTGTPTTFRFDVSQQQNTPGIDAWNDSIRTRTTTLIPMAILTTTLCPTEKATIA
jgi:hypothetical protein